MNADTAAIVRRSEDGHAPTDEEALGLALEDDLPALMGAAERLRDEGFGNLVTYSRKVFIPLTHLCRDVCHYCTFATTPRHIEHAYLPIERVVEVAREGAAAGLSRSPVHPRRETGTTLPGRTRGARRSGVRDHHRLSRSRRPRGARGNRARAAHEPGNMTPEELARLRTVSGSMGIMLESASDRLCEKGMPHHGSPDKVPAVRLQTLDNAGRARIPFTSGILIGIGETRRERIEALLELRRVHDRHGHVQEIIVQNFRAKPTRRCRVHRSRISPTCSGPSPSRG